MKKTLEELKSNLIEIQAYRSLQDEEFCFDNKNVIKNESKNSDDAYLEMQEQDLIEEIEELEENKIKKLKQF